MKLYLIVRTDSVGYDEYDSWVVAANTANEAGEFTKYETITIRPIGEAYTGIESGIILGSFNAG